MPLLSGGPLYRDRTKPIEDYRSSLGETFRAAVQASVDTGLGDFALGVAQFAIGDTTDGLQNMGRTFGVDAAAEIDPRNRVFAADARKKAEARGVKLDVSDDAYFSPGELDVVIRLKERERKRNAVLMRRPQTWGGFAAEMSGGFVGTLADPAQIAASFIPIVGPARYARWLKGASAGERAALRAGVGAAEGLVGAAVLEPFIYSRANAIGLDYTASDSFMNLAFGTVLGGGLHVMGGALADAVSPERRAAANAARVKARAALKEAVEAGDEGRAVDVGPVFRDARYDPMKDTAFLARELGRGEDVPDVEVARALEDVKAVWSDKTERPVDLVQAIRDMGGIRLTDRDGRVTSEGGDVRDIFNRRYPPGLVNNKTGIPLDYVREALEEQGWLGRSDGFGTNETTISDVLELLSRWSAGDKPRHPEADLVEDLAPTREEVKAAGITRADGEDVAAFKLAQFRAAKARAEAEDLIPEPALQGDSYDPVTGWEPPEYAAMREEAEAAVSRGDDGLLDDELDTCGEMVDAARARGTLSEDDENILALADAFAEQASLSSRAARAGAACILGVA